MPGQFAPSPKNRMLRRGGSKVSETGPDERGRLSAPHQIAVRAKYTIPLRTSSAPSNVRNILASQFIAAAHTPVCPTLTAFCAMNSRQTSSPPLQPGGFFFWIWRVWQAVDLALQGLAFSAAPVEPVAQTWRSPLFELSLKVQRDVAHNLLPGSRAFPSGPSTRADLQRSLTVKQIRFRQRARIPKPAGQTRTRPIVPAEPTTAPFVNQQAK
jgi:hypothetical protein